MDITFLKSILTGRRHKKKDSSRQNRVEMETRSFRDDQVNEKAFDTIKRGVCEVRLDHIVGSVGRYHDFDGKFRIKSHVPSDRLQKIKEAMRGGNPLPPVKLYQIKDEYYVLDGNHRVAAAKEFGYDKISARILEFIPSSNTFENILYREKSAFREETGLTEPIDLTEIRQYEYLNQQIQSHRNYLKRTSGERVPYAQAAEDWYHTIYTPLTGIIKKSGLLDHFSERTAADLYAYISFHQWEKGRRRKYGIGLDKLIPKDMEAFRQKMANIKEREYPEMKRGITAFVLITVKAKSEYRIMDKLYLLKEVQEIHSVHGEVDILVKVVLTRDLLTSDAEIIGDFVHENIRGISGVGSTRTLIPGYSKIKAQTG
ncbi:MAG: Lrp/AsnC ligand binding domain-containing protein [Deltaproteobacteria bacterium]|nr:Lrp/AsnC ligand binding domain-containing protein [Deltaproteobacteria bacterium]